jgi:polar amino acid transport system substrate-binding protein
MKSDHFSTLSINRRLMYSGMLATLLLLSACGKSGTTNIAQATGGDLLAEVKKRGKLLIATDANVKPFSFKKPDGSFEGFDVAVGQEVAKRLGVRAEFIAVDYDMITAGGWNGRWDMNAGSMTPTPNRRKSLYFSSPYWFGPAAFVVHKQSKRTLIGELTGRKIGTPAGSILQDYLENKLTLEDDELVRPPPAGIEPKIYQSDGEAITDLALGDDTRLDAILVALQVAEDAIKAGQPLKLLGEPLLYSPSCLAFDEKSPHGSKSLVAAVSTIVDAMHTDGTLAGLSKRYFGSDLTMKK